MPGPLVEQSGARYAHYWSWRRPLTVRSEADSSLAESVNARISRVQLSAHGDMFAYAVRQRPNG